MILRIEAVTTIVDAMHISEAIKEKAARLDEEAKTMAGVNQNIAIDTRAMAKELIYVAYLIDRQVEKEQMRREHKNDQLLDKAS
jgi:uncharacterized protein YfbU (UPF0304 family)